MWLELVGRDGWGTDMKRLTILFLLFALPAQAGPKDWIKHHKRFLLAVAAEGGAFAVQYKGTTYCQRGDVERCNEGYGSRRAFDWFSISMGAAMIPLSEKCHKEAGPKPACWGLAYWVPAAQTAFGIHDYLNYRPKEKNEP